MPHGGTGFFYYRYSYACPWTNPTNKAAGIDESFHTAVYTPVKKQDHEAQARWFNNHAMPVIEADIRKWYINVDLNNQGRNYERFNKLYIQEHVFKYCEALPPQPSGTEKGQPRGK